MSLDNKLLNPYSQGFFPKGSKNIKKFIIKDLNTPREVDPADTYQDVDSSGRAYDWDIENFTDTSHYIDQPEIGGWKHPDEM